MPLLIADVTKICFRTILLNVSRFMTFVAEILRLSALPGEVSILVTLETLASPIVSRLSPAPPSPRVWYDCTSVCVRVGSPSVLRTLPREVSDLVTPVTL